jgi:hypothetical protein
MRRERPLRRQQAQPGRSTVSSAGCTAAVVVQAQVCESNILLSHMFQWQRLSETLKTPQVRNPLQIFSLIWALGAIKRTIVFSLLIKRTISAQ